MCVIVTHNNICTYNNNIINNNYVVILYTTQQEMQQQLDILFNTGTYGQHFEEYVTDVNGYQYLTS